MINGATGKVAFDDNGDRIYAEYDIINVHEMNHKYPVGQYYFNPVSVLLDYFNFLEIY